ncbi:MAG: DUF2007 domain-containing protein [Pseudomonadota bacterium]
MKKVFSADNLVTVAHYRNVLEAEGIATEIRNQNLGGVLGEVPFTEVWPQLWVKHALDEPRARELIATVQATPEAGDPWICRHCQASNESHFAACWQCGAVDEAL